MVVASFFALRKNIHFFIGFYAKIIWNSHIFLLYVMKFD